MEINFTKTRHMILVGKNESGKSNILRALNLLSGKHEFQSKDIKEQYSGEAIIIFIFSLHPKEIENCADAFYKLFPAGINDQLTDNLTVQEFFKEHVGYILYVIRPKKKGYWHFWKQKPVKAADQWYRVANEIPQELQFSPPANVGSFVNQSYIQKLGKEKQEGVKPFLSEVKIEDIYHCLREVVKKIAILDNYTFPVVNWEYSASEHDLPNHVNQNEFAGNPDTCLPLLSMFLLAGIKKEDIQSKLTEAQIKGPNSIANALDTVNHRTNTYIKENWKEYKKVEIELRADGENIAIGIKEVNRFDFTQRSDGFRRLVSFLLMMSMVDKIGSLDEQLILIDEPEVGLHPSSEKDLRNKLIALGKNNLVVYATHSISMIDTETIENNFIVTKEKEETKIEVAKEDGTSSAENIYRAIGHSIYEDLKKVNILLEGYTDKKTLNLFMKGEEWSKFGRCFTGGVKNIEHVIPILDLVDRKYFILSDADEVAEEKKKKMGNPSYWYTYKDLNSDSVTIEDFYKQEFFSNIVTKILTKNDISIDGLELEGNRIKSIKDHFARNEVGGPNSKLIINEIKNECIKNIKKSNTDEEKITAVLNALLKKINST